MTEADVKKLVESAVAEVAKNVSQPFAALEARALRGDAMILANGIMADLALPDAAKAKVIERVTAPGTLPVTEGKVDEKKFGELLVIEIKREADYLVALNPDYGRVLNFGPSAISGGDKRDPKEVREAEKAERKALKRLAESEAAVFARLTGDIESGRFAASKGEAA